MSAVLTVSPDGTITSWSAGAQRLYGWTAQEVVGRPLLVLVPVDRREEFALFEQRLRDGEHLDRVETVRLAKDGRRVEVELHVLLLRDATGRATGSVLVHHDRGPLRRAQEALRAAERGMDESFTASLMPQARLRLDGVVLAVNPAATELLGVPAEVLVGRDRRAVIAAEDQATSVDVLTRLATGAAHFEQQEITLQTATGGRRRVLATTTTVREAGRVVALHTSLQDVTALRAAQERQQVEAARFEALVQSMPVAVWTFDTTGVCTSSRGAALAALGLVDDELVGVDLLERDRDDPDARDASLATLAGESSTLRRSVGCRDWESHFRPLRDDDGRVVGGIGIAVDVTERAVAERVVAANEVRLRALLRNADDVVIVLDVRGRMQWVSPALPRVFGHQEADIADRPAYELNPPEDQPVVRAAWDRVARTPGGTSTFTVRVRHADGGYRWTDQVLTNLLHDPDIAGIVVNVRDVTRHRAAEQEVLRLAGHDRMTGLANRALLLDRTGQALAAGLRTGEQTGLVVVDVVGMTAVNDLVGQAGGDVVLRTVADRLAVAVLGGDSVARLGADDFAVLVEDVASGEDLRARASILIEAGQGEVVVDGVLVPLVLRAGSAMTPAADAGALLAAAERSLATTTSRQVTVGSATLDEDERRNAEAVAELRTAIDAGQLRLHFQPLLGLRNGEVAGVEGLVRWEHPERGLLLPGAFIPLAETSGLVVPLGAWVLRQACAQAAAWHVQGQSYAVGANLSPLQLVGNDVVTLVRDLLAEYALPPERLVLEVTESTVMDDPHAPQVLAALSALGVHLALDDFGTGYSSLTYLKRFPVDAIKIDRSFVSGLGRDADDEAIVASVVSLARAIGKTVVAEGVETEGQCAALRALGVDQAQGFLWSAALPADELAVWMADRPEPAAQVGHVPASVPPRSPRLLTQGADEHRILALHSEGASLHTIAAALNAAGRRTPDGPRWTTRTVARVVAARAAPARSASEG